MTSAVGRQPLPPLPGDLLVACVGPSARMFAGAVILLVEADESGALGVVLNQVAAVELEDALPGWENVVSPPHLMFRGGPCEPSGALCLARSSEPVRVEQWRPVFEDVGLLHLDTPLGEVTEQFDELRVFAGYSGWAPGQLNAELEANAWYVVRGEPDDVFTPDPETLWRRVLRRSKSEVALFSTWTDHPELN